MKNTRGNTEKRELSLAEIRALMETKPTPCSITPRLAQDVPRSEDQEWFGVNADSERRKFNEETGRT